MGNSLDSLTIDDLRLDFFAGAAWYDALREPSDPRQETPWYVAKSVGPAWYIVALNAGLSFAQDKGLREEYRTRFAGIKTQDLSPERAKAEGRSLTSPVWEVANELIVARILERVTGWEFVEYEPPGRHGRKGDWLFKAPNTGNVFVEVKTVTEPELRGTGAFTWPDYTPRIRSILARAYRQLPDDGTSTLVVLVGNHILRIPFSIMHGDLFQALFGKMQITFNVMPHHPESVRIGPSLRNMFVHGTKHRRLGCAAGLVVSGLDLPSFRFYGIHNPFADGTVRIAPGDMNRVDQFVVDDKGSGSIKKGGSADELWQLII